MAPLEYIFIFVEVHISFRTSFEFYTETDIQSVWQVVAFVA